MQLSAAYAIEERRERAMPANTRPIAPRPATIVVGSGTGEKLTVATRGVLSLYQFLTLESK